MSARPNLPLAFDAVSLEIGQTTIVDRLTLELASGGPTLVIGPNGSGKSTILRLAMGLARPSAGSIAYAGGKGDPDRRAMVFQRPVMLRRSAAANVDYALPRGAGDRRARARRVDALLAKVGLSDLAGRSARALSGGEQQRVALARALARDPDILFLDEPTASLDPHSTRLVEAIVAEAAAEGIKIVMASHDLGQVRRLAGEVVLLLGGRLRDRRPAADFFHQPSTPEAAAFLRGDLVSERSRSQK